MVAAALAALSLHADPARAAVAVGYTPSARRFLGVPVPQVRALARAMRSELLALPIEAQREAVFALAASDVFEVHHLAYEVLAALPKLRRTFTGPDLVRIAEGNDNWASVDSWAVPLAGLAWREGVFTDAEVLAWTASPDRWWRRAALVCTVPLNMKSRGGKGDTARTLAVCARLATDRDPMVAKALSWALRELPDGDAVLEFLARHDVPALVRREVRTKLETGVKNARKARAG